MRIIGEISVKVDTRQGADDAEIRRRVRNAIISAFHELDQEVGLMKREDAALFEMMMEISAEGGE